MKPGTIETATQETVLSGTEKKTRIRHPRTIGQLAEHIAALTNDLKPEEMEKFVKLLHIHAPKLVAKE